MPNTASLTFKLFGIDISARRTIDDLGLAAAKTAHDLERLGTFTLKATAIAGAMGVAVAALSVAAVGAAGALGVGLGGAILGLGVKAALLNTQLKNTFKETGDAIKKEIAGINGPVVKSLTVVAGNVKKAFADIRPELASLFKAQAPVFSNLGKGLSDAIRSLGQQIGPLFATVAPLVNVFAKNLAPLLSSLVQMLEAIVQPLKDNIGAFQGFLNLVMQLLPAVGGLVGSLVLLGARVLPLFAPLITQLVDVLRSLLQSFGNLGAQILPTLNAVLGPLLGMLAEIASRVLPLFGAAIKTMLPSLGQLVGVILSLAAKVLPLLLPLIADLVSALAGALAEAIPALIPSFELLLVALKELLPAITPILPSVLYLARAVSNLIPPLAILAVAIIRSLAPAIQVLGPLLVKLVDLVGVGFLKAAIALAPILIRLGTAVAGVIIQAIRFTTGLVETVKQSTAVHNIIKQIADYFSGTFIPRIKVLGDAFKKYIIDTYKQTAEFLIRTFTPTVKALVDVFDKYLLPSLKNLWATIQRNSPALIAFAKFIAAIIVVVEKLFLRLVGFLLPILVKIAGFLLSKLFDLLARTIQYFSDLVRAVIKTYQGFQDFLRKANAVWDAFKKKVQDTVNDVATFLVRMVQTVKDKFLGARNWLLQAGRDVLLGFWDGLKAVWHDLTHWISTLTGWIKAHKGPIAFDRHLLYDEGHAIMTGFFHGLKAGGLQALGFVKEVATNVRGAFGATQDVSFGAMQSMVQGWASMLYGWTGGQWVALNKLLTRESNFNPNAQNPTSTAYGLFQFLDSTWGAVGAQKTSNPYAQTLAGLRYIAQRYGGPIGAWIHEMAYGWYGSGLSPTVFSKPTLIGVGERGPETVSVTPGYGGAAGTIIVNLNGTFIGVDKYALGNWVTQAIREKQRREGRAVTV